MEQCLNWHRAEDRWRRDWLATCKNWILKGIHWEEDRANQKRKEKPQYELDKRGGKMTDMKDILKVVK